MAPRKPRKSAQKAVPLAEVIASSARTYREGRAQLTQGELAEKMNELGFSTWSQTTVTEVEGRGRGRRLGLAELLGLASVLGVTVADLLTPSDGASIELTPGGMAVSSMPDLVALILPVEVVADVAEDLARATMKREMNRLRELESTHLYVLASWLRDTAGKFEQTADELTAQSEEAS